MIRPRTPEAPTFDKGIRVSDGTRKGAVIRRFPANLNKPEFVHVRWDGEERPDSVQASRIKVVA